MCKGTEAGDWWSPHSTSLRRAESQISTTFLPSITTPMCMLSLLSSFPQPTHLPPFPPPPSPPTKKNKVLCWPWGLSASLAAPCITAAAAAAKVFESGRCSATKDAKASWQAFVSWGNLGLLPLLRVWGCHFEFEML